MSGRFGKDGGLAGVGEQMIHAHFLAAVVLY